MYLAILFLFSEEFIKRFETVPLGIWLDRVQWNVRFQFIQHFSVSSLLFFDWRLFGIFGSSLYSRSSRFQENCEFHWVLSELSSMYSLLCRNVSKLDYEILLPSCSLFPKYFSNRFSEASYHSCVRRYLKTEPLQFRSQTGFFQNIRLREEYIFH